MKQILLITSIILFFSMNTFGQIERQIQNFSEIPKNILAHLDKMGMDTSQVLNNYEGDYLNFIFKVAEEDFDLIGKKVAFRHAGKKSKKDYFEDEKERFCLNSTPVGGAALYIFNTAQKEESGGYDAAIVYWSKKLLSTKEVVKRLKEKN